ncbi:MAG TPA: Sec-independent protein translocase protein TatB [Devosiaceae bacterium]|nr:Sec-independent protein translocase protein TatB [Devosiaceae bacterium]
MLSIGWSEMLIVAAVALIVVGPRDLPGMLRQLGRAAGTIRRMGNEFRTELNKVAAVDDLRQIKSSVADPLKAVQRDITREFNKIDGSTVSPTGAIKPKVADAESVDEVIREQAGLPAPAAAAATGETTAATGETAETAPPPAAKKPRPRKKPATTKTSAAKPATAKSAAARTAAEAPKAEKPATPRRSRAKASE